MKTDRRDFLKITGLAGLAGMGVLSGCANEADSSPVAQTHRQTFNMSGYAAPRLDKVRIGVIGVGNRGSGHVRRLARMEGVDMKALCDLVPENITRVANDIRDYAHNPELYSGSEDDWKKVCERDDIDVIVIATPWHLHTPIAVHAMNHGKHVGVEVPAAVTIDECWQLVETSERTRKHCMMMANPCYGDFQMMTLNMARQGFFGEIIHGEGAYVHQLLMSHNFSKTAYHDMWRLKENANRNGNLYPTHGLGTICQVMNINCGDKMDYLVSVSSDDFMMGETARELAATDEFFAPFADKTFRGNMNTSTIRTRNGRTIVVQHDVTSPRPNVRFNMISGTKAFAQQYPRPQIALSHDGWLSDEEYDKLAEQYRPEISKRVGEMARQLGGHGGVDTLMAWRFIDCLRNGLPLDMNVYDAALWSSIAPLSEWSVANRSNSIDVPDFTSGSWQTNKPGMDIELAGGGTTKIA